MTRWFNVAGPCRPAIHYMLPATARLPDVMRLINQQSYFVRWRPTDRRTHLGSASRDSGRAHCDGDSGLGAVAVSRSLS